MEIRTLKYFIAVAREENMTRAAEILHVSQPTLSRALKSLEDELGKKLFNRHNFSITLTDEGVLLRDRANDLVDMAEKITGEFMSLDKITGGDIHFGLAESYHIRYLAREIKQLKQKYPDLHYHITSGDTEQLIDKLDKGLLDFAVLAEVPNFQKYNTLKFPESDVWGLIMPNDDLLARKKCISFEDLKGLPLFCSGQGWQKDIAKWCNGRTDELCLEGSFRLVYNGAIFVKEKLGYLLCFDKLVDTSDELVFRPLYPKLETALYLVWKKYPVFSRMSEIFLKKIKAAFNG